MRLLAVDPGSMNTGLYDGQTAELIELSSKKLGNPNANVAERLALLMNRLSEYLLLNPVDFVVYEEQFVRGGPTTKALFGAVGIIEAVAHNNSAGTMSVPQASIRKWAYRKAFEAVGEAELNRLDTKGVYRCVAGLYTNAALSEHECDAVCIYHYVLENQHED